MNDDKFELTDQDEDDYLNSEEKIQITPEQIIGSIRATTNNLKLIHRFVLLIYQELLAAQHTTDLYKDEYESEKAKVKALTKELKGEYEVNSQLKEEISNLKAQFDLLSTYLEEEKGDVEEDGFFSIEEEESEEQQHQ